MIPRRKVSPKKKGGQINELLRAELAQLIEQRLELPGTLITVTKVESSPDLNYAKISISVLPEKFTGTALELLRKNTGAFSKALLKKTRLRHIPRFNWHVDDTEMRAAEIDELFKQLK
jgi:ribosome-binding factor A